jgi:hypothetical protein
MLHDGVITSRYPIDAQRTLALLADIRNEVVGGEEERINLDKVCGRKELKDLDKEFDAATARARAAEARQQHIRHQEERERIKNTTQAARAPALSIEVKVEEAAHMQSLKLFGGGDWSASRASNEWTGPRPEVYVAYEWANESVVSANDKSARSQYWHNPLGLGRTVCCR